MERSNFPHRNLDEDDEELLNGIWAGLETRTIVPVRTAGISTT